MQLRFAPCLVSLALFTAGCGGSIGNASYTAPGRTYPPVPQSEPAGSPAQLSPTTCVIDGQPVESLAPDTTPNPPSGAPSETLANALRLYQQERYQEAAAGFQQVMTGATHDAPVSTQQAEFYLGKCLFHMSAHDEAESVFLRIVHDTGNPYRHNAIEWVCKLQGAPTVGE